MWFGKYFGITYHIYPLWIESFVSHNDPNQTLMGKKEKT